MRKGGRKESEKCFFGPAQAQCGALGGILFRGLFEPKSASIWMSSDEGLTTKPRSAASKKKAPAKKATPVAAAKAKSTTSEKKTPVKKCVAP